jgi:bidirectional [NiFe] hydrogenase diaphorase subunit
MNGPPLAEPAQEVPSPAAGEVELRVCMAAACLAIGGQHVRQALAAAAQAQGAAQHGGASTRVRGSGCLRLCSWGPLVLRRPDGVVYAEVTPEQAPAIVAESGPAPSVPAADRAASPVRLPPDLPFFARQQRIVIEHLGAVDPEHIEEYLAAGGYAALAKALHDLSPAQVIDEVTQSGLRGRGGAGYPTGVKWNLVAKTGSGQKYVVCNGDEGDPGAFVDRSVMEGDPHRILEGMAIAGYAVGANQGYLYVRGEYPLAIERLQ